MGNFFILFILFFSFLFHSIKCTAQNDSDSLLAKQYIEKGINYYNKFNFDKSIFYYNEAAEIYRNHNNDNGFFYCKNQINFVYFSKIFIDKNNSYTRETFLLNIRKTIIESQMVFGSSNVYEATAYLIKSMYSTGIIKNYDSALHYSDKSIEVFEFKNDSPFREIGWGLCINYRNRIHTLIKAKRFKEARLLGEKALISANKKFENNQSTLHFIYEGLGSLYHESKNYHKAIFYYQKSLKDRKKYDYPYLNPNLIENIGRLYLELNNFSKAVVFFEKTLLIKKKIYPSHHIQILKSYNRIGGVYQEIGKYDEAISYYQQALEGVIALRGPDNKGSASFYNNIGEVLQLQGKYKEALKTHQKALKIRLKTIGGSAPYTTNSYHNIGKAFLSMQQYDSAHFFLKTALDLRLKLDKIRPDMKKYVADSYNNMGLICLNTGKLALAIHYHQKALTVLIKLYGEKHPQVANTYNYIGKVYLTKNKFNLALNNFQKALIANSIEFNNSNSDSLPKPDDFVKPYIFLTSLKAKAVCLEKKYATQNASSFLKSAYKVYQFADLFLSSSRKKHSNQADKQNWMQNSRAVYEGGIRVGTQLYKLTNNKDYINQAFIFSEKSKARILSDKTIEVSAKSLSNIPDSLLKIEHNLASEIASYNIRLQREKLNNKSISKIKAFTDSLFLLKRKENQLITQFEKQFPKYYNLKYKQKDLTITEVQNALPPETTFIEYFLTNNFIYVFVIGKKEYSFHQINKDSEQLVESIEKLNQSINKKNAKTFYDNAYGLYQSLIIPFEKQIQTKKIIFVPDGVLWHLNFDMLLTDKVAHNSYQKFPYLIKKYILSYSYSADLLFYKDSIPQKNIRKECLAFSYSDSENIQEGNLITMRAYRDTLKADLPGTRREIADISQIMDGKYYYGSYANEKNFKKTAKDYAILHLALHGSVNEKKPLHSKLIFTENNSDTTEDNQLYAYELYNMQLNAELAVLSACNTGTGKLEQSGEGVMSLGRAFMYAGCKSLLMSQWEISDWSTSGIMKSFYTFLNQGLPKDEALHKAKLTYIAKSDNLTGRPIMWAPLVLLGDSTPYKEKSNNLYVFYLIAGILLLVAIYGVRKFYF